MKMPQVWAILEKFKNTCKLQGWRTFENEDLIGVGDEYHHFLYMRDVHQSSFNKIASSRKCAVREGLSYRIIEASYTAWLFLESPSKTFFRMVLENPNFCERNALYDLSPLLEGRNICTKINRTDSMVFKEFENFLEKKLNVRFRSFKLSESKTLLDNDTIEELV